VRPSLSAKVLDLPELLRTLAPLREKGARVVLTNGCFDLLHPGHVTYLEAARDLGDVLVVALNSDQSVRRLKGPERPILSEGDRAIVLAGLRSVTYVVVFAEDTPRDLIGQVLPDVLVKGGDWAADQIVGKEEVERAGGRVATIPFVAGQSTTGIVERVLQRNAARAGR
jgi:D-beta-D-heptose 7-phosphate kinase/D-beta-D-heptose 1-phosphate adenosyltransferase